MDLDNQPLFSSVYSANPLLRCIWRDCRPNPEGIKKYLLSPRAVNTDNLLLLSYKLSIPAISCPMK